MDEQTILKQLNLSEEDFKDLVTKHQAFVSSLNPAQLAVVKASMPSAEDAAKTFGPTGAQLTSFVNARLGKSATPATQLFFVAPSK